MKPNKGLFLILALGFLVSTYNACSRFQIASNEHTASSNSPTDNSSGNNSSGNNSSNGNGNPSQLPSSSPWPNEPTGFRALLNCGFETPLCDGKLLDPYNATGLNPAKPSMHTVSVVQDTSAPLSPSSVYRSMMDYQVHQGGSETHFYTQSQVKEIYVGIWWRSNPDFTANGVGANKTFFIRGPGLNGVFLWQKPRGSNLSRLYWTTQMGNNLDQCGGTDIDACFANGNDVFITPGNWYRIEVYMKASSCATCRDGVVKWWITPKGGTPSLAGNYSNFAYGPVFDEWVWSETWDGFGNAIGFTSDPAHYLDHLYISVR